jgi:hypothetical protein
MVVVILDKAEVDPGKRLLALVHWSTPVAGLDAPVLAAQLVGQDWHIRLPDLRMPFAAPWLLLALCHQQLSCCCGVVRSPMLPKRACSCLQTPHERRGHDQIDLHIARMVWVVNIRR